MTWVVCSHGYDWWISVNVFNAAPICGKKERETYSPLSPYSGIYGKTGAYLLSFSIFSFSAASASMSPKVVDAAWF